ncbi:hypothetical protein [Mangrovimonas spongiae]|uniref:DUF1735 domain-containing protein n=1 Tax=Mangrovimonas spongiae TaxID=2494697 RepID=A0A3R9P179_9FLAO|nr:hypothetical protein [Mangrovimonas spongiae]RSK42076.1 hypothetical protein EJA19_04120 [Mangrovimonas spongiae]
MKNYRILSLLLCFVALTMTTSCLVDDEVESDSYGDSPSLAGFTSAARNLSAVADGEDKQFGIDLSLVGPASVGNVGSVDVVVSVDPSSTAIEGTHYSLTSMSTTLQASNNYIGSLPLTVITEGITPPLAVSPVLKLNIESVNGSNVIPNGLKDGITLTFIYQCFADLSGTYVVTNDFCGPTFTTTIASDGQGGWLIGSADGGFLHQCTSNTSLLNAGTIIELCGEILPSTNLEFGTDGGYGIGDILGGTWNGETGVLTMQHQDVFFNGGPFFWTSTYTRQ